MSEASGWGIIPVTISMSGATKELNKQLVGPAKKAGKDAGTGIEQGVSKSAKTAAAAVEKASDQQVRARDRASDAADKTKLAELKLSEVQDKSNAKTSEIVAATQRLEKARRDQERADSAAEKATENLTQAQKRLDSAQAQAKGSGLEVAASMKDVEQSAGDAGGSLDDLVGKLGGLAGAAAGVGSIGAVIAEGFDMQTSIDMMNNQLGLTGAAAQDAADQVSVAMRGGVAGGVDEATEAIGSLQSQFKYLGFEGEQTAGDLSDNFLAFTKTFGVDMQEATQTAGQLIQNGLATDVEDAADLMTASFQRVPAAMRDEMPEILNEYGQNFKNLGFSGEQAFGLLAAQAEKGKFALDKTGDALKEFTIRGTDMSESSTTAFETLGLSAEEMADKIVQGGPGAQEALKQTAQALLDVEDPTERSNLAISLFGTQMEDLGVDQVPAFMDALASGSDSLGDFQGSSQELADQMSNSLEGRMNALKGTVQDLAGQGFMKLWDALEPIVEWARDNSAWLTPIAVGIGVFAGALTLAATGAALWAGAQMLLNTALFTSPITWIVAAIAGLVAALVWVFTKTEWGQKVWEGFMDVLKGVWEWIKGTFGPVFSWLGDVIGDVWQGILDGWDLLWQGIQTAWNSVLKPVLDLMWTVISTTIGIIGTVILAPLLIAWNLLSWGISAAWNNIIKPAWDAMSIAIQWLWNNVLSPVFGWISAGWQLLTDGIKWAWENVTKPAWDALQAAAQWMWYNVLSPVFGFIKSGWDLLSQGISAIWNNVIRPVWDTFGSVIDFVVHNVVEPAFEAVKTALGKVGDFFGSVVDGIKSVWNGLKSILAKPINFMIGTVYNGGILKAWNTIADFIPGLNPAAPLAEIQENATGGAIRGPGTGTSDDILSWLSNGEHVLTAADVKALGGQGGVYALRNLVQSGEPFTWDGRQLKRSSQGIADNGPLIPAFKDGGEIRPEWESQLERGHEWAAAQNGKPYLTGSQWPSGGDCSGFMSAIASVILGQEPNAGHWATPAFPATQASSVSAGGQAWEGGLSQGFSIGMTGGPQSGGAMGHTAGTLSSAGKFSSVNVESGGGHGNVAYGGPAAGADDGQWTSGNYHLAIGADGAFESAGSVSPEKKKGFLRDKIKDIFDELLSPIDGMFASAVGTPPPEWFSIPPDAMHSSKDKMIDWLFDRIEDLGNLLGGAYNKAKDLGSAITDGVKDAASGLWNATGGKLFDTGGMLESGGVAVNQSGKPERILSPGQTETFEDLLELLPALLAGTAGVDAEAVLRDTAAAFGESHPDVAGEIAKGLGDGALDFFGLKGTWMTDPSQLGISWGEEKTEVVEDTVSADALSEATAAPTVEPSSPLYQDLDDVDPDRHVAKTGPAAYVAGIVNSAIDHDLPASGARIGVATALVESGDPLQMFANNSVPESLNYPHDAVGSDYDSVGLFQQRDNGAWGTVAQRMDPYESAGMFFDAMLSKYPNWQSMDPGAVAQGVQVSAYPDRYNTKMSRADELVAEAGLYDQGGILPDGALAVNLSGSPEHVFTDTAMEDFVNATAVLEEAAAHIEQAASDLSLARPAEVTGTASVTSTVEVEDTATTTTGGAKSGRQSADNGMVVNLVMENVNTTDPNAASREMMREARRVLAAFV
ncbi:phage tail tape measure protein [Corynebacterium variabile]|uniref:phage tail tape measure protein n=1 Tax=Corynebacterium variabile TaxID=1727 RepID=UPI002897296D|nr:phage tail tape measure protein [Corynebacterium variabile]